MSVRVRLPRHGPIVQRSGRKILNLETRVQLPLGLRSILRSTDGLLAQGLERFPVKEEATGSRPVQTAPLFRSSTNG
jgi:hypothetical protein